MAPLQSAEISDNGPAVGRGNVGAVRPHQVLAKSDRIKNLTIGLLWHATRRFRVVEVSDDGHAELGRDAFAVPCSAVTWGTVDIESFLAAGEQGTIQYQ